MGTNWAGNLTYQAQTVHTPRSLVDLQGLIAAGGPLKPLGSRHSFSTIADTTGAQVTLAEMPVVIAVDADTRTAVISAWLTYAEASLALDAQGWALHNMASLPHISLVGAVTTATHGSGNRNGNLSTAVSGIEFVNGLGEVIELHRGDADFDGVVVGIGALGVVTRLWLDVQPSFSVRQTVFDGMELDTALANLEAITASAYSVSVFTDWRRVTQIWLKSVDGEAVPAELFGSRPAESQYHPLAEGEVRNTTVQGGVPGPWLDRLPHFVMGFTPSNGSELQSEFFVARADAPAAIDALRAFADRISDLILVTELRTMAADELWLSGAYGRDTLGIHFTWQQRQDEVENLLVDLEAALAPFGARPHWGKVFTARGDAVRSRYPRFEDFRALVARHDPDSVFRNDWLVRVLGL